MVFFNYKITTLLFGVITVVYGITDYTGYKIYETIPSSIEHVNFLYNISLQNDAIDMLTLTKIPNFAAHAMVPPGCQQNFENILTSNGIQFKIVECDVSNLILSEKFENQIQRTGTVQRTILNSYYRHGEMNAYLDQLANKYPKRVTVKTIGYSYENRAIKSIAITNERNNKLLHKKVIFIDGGIHAREWISPAAALYVVHQLVENFEINKHLLDHYEWIIVPTVNPDGYEYSHTIQRFWRKNRKPSSNFCYGTDINRNFDYNWGDTSSLPCQETYKGHQAFSEPESQVLRDALLSVRDHGKMYLSLHSHGKFFLYPWSYTKQLPDNWKQIDQVAQAGANAIRDATGNIYTVGSTTNVLYEAAGSSQDYALGLAKFPIAITMELPSGGFGGFDPKPWQIKSMVSETWFGIKGMAEEVMK